MISKAKNEIWKSVPGFSLYKVSSTGRVQSFARSKRWKFLKPSIGSHGYYGITFGRGNHRTLHSIIALTFFGPANGRWVNHKNGIKTDNRLVNIEYVTPAGNIQHAFRTGLMNNTGEFHGRATRTNMEVLIIREAISLGYRQSDVARYFKMPAQTVNGIIKRRSFVSI